MADTGNNRIQKLSPRGQPLVEWGHALVFTTVGFMPFRAPRAVAVDPAGSVYVADTGRNRIVKLSAQGRVLEIWGSPGHGSGQLDLPQGIAVDPRGHIYVADTGNRRIVELSVTGHVVAGWGRTQLARGGMDYPQRLAVDERGDMYVVGLTTSRLVELSPLGHVVGIWRW